MLNEEGDAFRDPTRGAEVGDALDVARHGLPRRRVRSKRWSDETSLAGQWIRRISPAEADQAMRSNPNTLVIDARDAADIAATGIIPGAINISLGT